MKLRATVHGRSFSFSSVREVLAKASEEKSGDLFLGIAAGSASERVAARYVLSELTLEDLRNNPVIPYEADAVTRLIEDDLNDAIFAGIKHWTLGELRDHLLGHEMSGDDVLRISRGLNAEMIAGVAKLMSNMDLVYGARKIRVVTRAATQIGMEGTLSFRLQPNHPTDSIQGIMASVMEGLSYGSGDAIIGINPVEDSVASTTRILQETWDFMSHWRIPTQNCVLSHITTQMEAVAAGAPGMVLFQSIAGNEKTNDSFGVTAALLDEAYDLILKKGLAPGPNLLYFETGQGSEMASGYDLGVDEMTLEARTYAFGRRWRPFMVNNVSGFIGPETLYDGKQITRACLEDHYMGKLAGLPMGVAPCYTNHTQADQNDQETATMLLAMAGANYYMGVPMGDDIMLSYQDTGLHDDATLRELMGFLPAPEFNAWCEKMGFLRNGKLAERGGDASVFLARSPRDMGL
ncbi:ethanolamine ammonia-lyase [Alkalispirochaeta sphaeroplastigenens]|uniref:Ethanolamine ammonia-lyase large subunit n=1 Tax=Alkalispirochaeta sphaeroplastigenens TaxID=1187066 RepID=A0A2S4JHG4_9SPIO|nr:ethanolamine ammonia-lyase subunit EutB [Alkalispirochaeta sphaeroplastigenens]POQ98941.1 ethanolamine ammonia-lyase [Alkalispirochaeta sphaeroplastigenens]